MTSGVFTRPGWQRVFWGAGSRDQLPDIVAERPGSRVLILTGRTLHTKTDVVTSVAERLGSAVVGVFDGTRAHTPIDTVFAAIEAVTATNADTLLVVGGSSVIDTSRAVVLALATGSRTPAQLRRYVIDPNDVTAGKVAELTAAPLRQLALTTTLAASEYSGISGVTHPDEHVKLLYGGQPGLFVDTVVLDPEVTVHTPQDLWLSGGIKILDNATEVVCSSSPTPISTTLALETLRVLPDSLRHTQRDPNDLQARLAGQLAAWHAIFAPHNVWAGVGAALRHQLGARYDIVHGYASTILTPHVLEYNLPATAAVQRRIAQALGGPDAGSAADEFRAVVRGLGLPSRLRDVAVPREDLGLIAQDALLQFVATRNPVPPTADGLRELLERAW
ncbi:iron-containing alcohol dehydrogenase [Phytohabitans kaempferiae]|uniref:Iron-containing alcohol dehydrogenase n=1 Tax=Phytohabitans kaempferiae TaxID=1620943 RepID=A0ABV6M778_9ACTN